MGASPGGRRRRLGAVAVALAVAIMGSSLAASSTGASATGSSCAHPWTATYEVGGSGGGFEGDQQVIYMSGTTRLLNWDVRQGRVICSVRIQLADGRLAAPTKLLPYSTPTPTGGEYKAPPGPRSPLRKVIITAARSPVPPGTSCNYPVFSSDSIDGSPSNGSDTKDFSVKVNVVHDPEPGSAKPMTLRLVVTIHNPHIAICRAELTVFPPNPQGFIRGEAAKPHMVAISPSGTVTSRDVVVPSHDAFAGVAYARIG
jgi:hypothetical protein